MKILYIHQYFNTPSMSGGTRSYELAKRLVSQGHEVHMIASARDGKASRFCVMEEVDGIKVHWLRVAYSNKMSFHRRLFSFILFILYSTLYSLRFSKLDVVFATSTPLSVAIPGYICSRINGVPFVFEVRDLWPDVPVMLGVIKNRFLIKCLKWFEAFIYRKASFVVALAPGMKNSIVSLGKSSSRVVLIPNGCDRRFNNVDIDGVDLLLNEFPQLKNKVIGVYAGAMGFVNGIDFIINLALKSLHENIAFVLIGDGAYSGAAIDKAASLGLLDRNMFFIGRRPKDEIPAWLALSTFSLITYSGPSIVYRDSVCNKFFDAIASRKFIVANYNGYSTDIAEGVGCAKILSDEEINTDDFSLFGIIEELSAGGGYSYFLNLNDYFSRDRHGDMLGKVLSLASRRERVDASFNSGLYYYDISFESRS